METEKLISNIEAIKIYSPYFKKVANIIGFKFFQDGDEIYSAFIEHLVKSKSFQGQSELHVKRYAGKVMKCISVAMQTKKNNLPVVELTDLISDCVEDKSEVNEAEPMCDRLELATTIIEVIKEDLRSRPDSLWLIIFEKYIAGNFSPTSITKEFGMSRWTVKSRLKIILRIAKTKYEELYRDQYQQTYA